MPSCQDLFAARDAKQAEIDATAALVNAAAAVLAAYQLTLQNKTMELNVILNQIASQQCT